MTNDSTGGLWALVAYHSCILKVRNLVGSGGREEGDSLLQIYPRFTPALNEDIYAVLIPKRPLGEI
jgi:hypothetical protein